MLSAANLYIYKDMPYEHHNLWFVYVLTHVWKTISLFWKINKFQYGYLGVSSSQYLNEFLVWLTNYKKTFILQILHEIFYTYITSTFSPNKY